MRLDQAFAVDARASLQGSDDLGGAEVAGDCAG